LLRRQRGKRRAQGSDALLPAFASHAVAK